MEYPRKWPLPVGICHVPTSVELILNHGLRFAETALAANKCHCLHEGIFLFERHRPIAWHFPIGGTDSQEKVQAWMATVSSLAKEINALGMVTAIMAMDPDEGEILAMRAESADGSVASGFRTIKWVSEIPYADGNYIIDDSSYMDNLFDDQTFLTRKYSRRGTRQFILNARQQMLASRGKVAEILAANHYREECVH